MGRINNRSRWEEFSDWAEKGKALQNELLRFVDEDTRAFNLIVEAFGLAKSTEDEKIKRKAAIQEATKKAIMVPFDVMKTAFKGFEIVKAMIENGNPNSITDAAVGTLAIRACIRGAYLNVKINAIGFEDTKFASDIIDKGKVMEDEAARIEDDLLNRVALKLS